MMLLKVVVIVIVLLVSVMVIVIGFLWLVSKRTREWQFRLNLRMREKFGSWWGPFRLPEINEKYERQYHIWCKIFGAYFVIWGIFMIVLIVKMAILG